MNASVYCVLDEPHGIEVHVFETRNPKRFAVRVLHIESGTWLRDREMFFTSQSAAQLYADFSYGH